MPTARAPMPILRKLPVVVAMRSWPTAWARTQDGATSPRRRTARAGRRRAKPRLEVIVEPQSPAHGRTLVRRVQDDAVHRELVRILVLPHADLGQLPGALIDAAGDLPVEDVLAGEEQAERLLAHGKVLGQPQVEQHLERAVLRVAGTDRVLLDVLGRVSAP